MNSSAAHCGTLFVCLTTAVFLFAPANHLPGAGLPAEFGLAAKYPGDCGIVHDPQVLFVENFESSTIADLAKRWDNISDREDKVFSFSEDVSVASAGNRSMQMTATLGQNTGGHLYTRLPRSVDQAFARFYVKFASDADYIHHFVHMGGYQPATRWPQGGAGERPRGDERMTIGIEPWGNYGRFPAPGGWHFYAYWHEMKISSDGKYWGNGLSPVTPAPVPRDRWQCVEIMMKCNSAPEKADGELALWLDGKLIAHFTPGVRRSRWTGMGFSLTDSDGEVFEGFRWRKNDDLKINFFWLLHYVTENATRQNKVSRPNPTNCVWFDDIVISTVYIGPVSPLLPQAN